MKLAIKELLKKHEAKTGEKITQAMIAREMVKKGYANSFYSARNMLQYNIKGTAQSIDKLLLQYLCERFDCQPNDIIIW